MLFRFPLSRQQHKKATKDRKKRSLSAAAAAAAAAGGDENNVFLAVKGLQGRGAEEVSASVRGLD